MVYRGGRKPGALGKKSIEQRVREKSVRRMWTLCREWRGAFFVSGYGQLRYGGVLKRAHILAYEAVYGPVPDGMELDHYRYPDRCIGPACVEPRHLRVTTHRVNSLRSSSPWAVNARKTHCKHGHEFTSSNTIIRKDGCRECRQCRDNRLRAWRMK